MRSIFGSFAAVVVLALAASNSSAQYYSGVPAYYPAQPGYPARVAPDMCGPYFYCTDGCTWYGPSYNVYPPFPPVGGVQVPLSPMQPAALPYNPWIRSPRDFFMWSEAQKERGTREVRPPFAR